MDLDVCRICLKQEARNNALGKSSRMIDIFGKKNIVKQISDCAGVMQREDITLPQRMCGKCSLLLQHAVEFRTKCRSSNEHLLSLKQKLNMNNACEKQTSIIKESSGASSGKDDIKNNCATSKTLNFAQVMVHHNVTGSEVLEFNDNNAEQLIDAPKSENTEKFVGIVECDNRGMTEQENNEVKNKKKARARVNPKNYICDQCGNHFTCRHHFVTHLRRHAGDKQFQCELCPDKFFTHSELNRHMRKHTGERPFPCQYCGRKFTDYSTRIKHERTHTNERPFKCIHCSKAFTSSYILKNHLLTHTGERSFRCTSCNKSFQRQSHLVVHYRSLMHKQNEEKLKITD